MREGRIDAALDWLPSTKHGFSEVTLFDDVVVAAARRAHPALLRIRSIKDLKAQSFVSLRPRVQGEHPVPGLREWQRLELHVALEVSEILEVFMVAAQSDLVGIIPRSMIRFARERFGLEPLPAGPRIIPVPVRLLWHASRTADGGHAFLRQQIASASADVVPRSSR